MTNSGDAAEQIVRLSLEGTEVALRLSGSAAKNIAAAIYTVLKNRDKNKIKGRQRLTAMLKSGKELKVFTISEDNLNRFAKEANRYGVVYCALRGKEKSDDGMVDIMVRAEDAAKINRIVERFKLATVDAASIKRDIEEHRKEQKPQKDETDILIDDIVTDPKEKAKENPPPAKTERSSPSEPTLKEQKSFEKSFGNFEERPSVRKLLDEIKEKQHKQEEPKTLKKNRQKPLTHIPPKKKLPIEKGR